MASWYIDENGYRRFSDSGELVSRWVKEKQLGRPLNKSERVHHVNRDKEDNSARNLWVFKNQKEHDNTHRRDKKKYGEW